MPTFSAVLRAPASARVLKPMTTALDACARCTSDSLIAPTAAWMTSTLTSSVESFCSDWTKASCEPCTSALMISASVFVPPSPICPRMFSRLAACFLASFTSRNFPCRNSAISRALRSSAKTIASWPADGTSERPSTSTGIDGPASLIVLPSSSSMARIRPNT